MTNVDPARIEFMPSLACIAPIALAFVPAALSGHGEELVPSSVLRRLRSATKEIAETGERRLVERMREVLAGLGDAPKDLEPAAEGWERTLSRAKPGSSGRRSAERLLHREVENLVVLLGDQTGEAQTELARWILELDSQEPTANGVLGRSQDADGTWLDAERLAWLKGARRTADRVRDARRLLVETTHGESENEALLNVAGAGNVVRSHGIEVHSRFGVERLERILQQALRAVGLAQGLLHGSVQVPERLGERAFVLLDTNEHYLPALEQAFAAKKIPEDRYRLQLAVTMRSFVDMRGWRTSRLRSEADYSALIAWDVIKDLLGEGAQPCLRTGIMNWVCLRALGTQIPVVVWSELKESLDSSDRSTADRSEALQRQFLWRSARRTLWGCRSWLLREARAGRDPPWARSMVAEDGEITDENLLKTTMACELLLDEDRAWETVEATRGATDRVAAMETALGEPLPEFEARWRRWLEPPTDAIGIVQELARGPQDQSEANPFRSALTYLDEIRRTALDGQAAEVESLTLEPELSEAAALHARYLDLNPEQKSVWPDVHEEFSDRPGFTPRGSLAGSRSVISFASDPIEAIDSWMGTVYHRLPLLDPGLFAVGFGVAEGVVVLDAGSLVLAPWKDHAVFWPPPGATDVPVAFQSEIPTPLPGVDLATLGYPITAQIHRVEPENALTLTLQLYAGDSVVDAYRISPEAPLNLEHVPPDAWALVPKQPLAAGARYTVRAAWEGKEKVWSFTTAK